MELAKKIKILTLVIILLVIFNITVIITILLNHNKYEKFSPSSKESVNFHNKHHQKHEQHFCQILTDELELNEQQTTKINNYRQNFKDNSHIYFDSIKAISDIIDNELAKDTPNQILIKENAELIGKFHVKLKLNFAKYYTDIKKELNKEQQNEFHELILNFKHRKHRHNHHKHYRHYRNK